MAKIKTLAQQMAELEDPVPKDFDPEDNVEPENSDEGSEADSAEEGAGTEHYVAVGKSKLRKPTEVALGPKYAGSRVSREALEESEDDDMVDEDESEDDDEADIKFADPDSLEFEVDDEDGDIDSDDALGESDDEKFKDFAFRGSRRPRDGLSSKESKGKRKTAADFMSESDIEEEIDPEDLGSEPEDDDDEDMEDISDGSNIASEDGESEEEDMDDTVENMGDSDVDDEDDHDDEEAEDQEEEDNGDNSQRSLLKTMMANQQKSVVASISLAAKVDAEKGAAVKQQRKTFDTLLNVRIRLQKALIATNSIAAAEGKVNSDLQPYQAAEEAAIKLFNSLSAMRDELDKAGKGKVGSKRKREFDTDTESAAIWQTLKASEKTATETRHAVLERWAAKVRQSTTSTRNLNNSTQQTVVGMLEDQLSNSERLVKRTKMPRSCAPVQVKAKVVEDANIYDDADFYQLLLKELVDQRMVDSNAGTVPLGDGGKPMAQWTAVKEAKTRKNVDTKASKGRKMKFTVHEKLQNFMAPEDRCAWEQDAIDRFFGTLLGQKMNLGEEADDISDNDAGAPLAEEALMLFRS